MELQLEVNLHIYRLYIFTLENSEVCVEELIAQCHRVYGGSRYKP